MITANQARTLCKQHGPLLRKKAEDAVNEALTEHAKAGNTHMLRKALMQKVHEINSEVPFDVYTSVIHDLGNYGFGVSEGVVSWAELSELIADLNKKN